MWHEKSHQLAFEFITTIAPRNPEMASELGLSEFDDQVISIDDNHHSYEKDNLYIWQKKLTQLLKTPHLNAEFKTDISILLRYVQNELDYLKVQELYPIQSFCPVVQFVYKSLSSLSQVNSRAITKRFHKYVNGQGIKKPLIENCRSSMDSMEKSYGSKLVRPYIKEIQQYLEYSSFFLNGIKSILKRSKLSNWKANFQKFSQQVHEHEQYLRKNINQLSRDSIPIPEPLYTAILHRNSINSTPQALIRIAQEDFKKEFAHYHQLAHRIAKKHKLRNSTPSFIIKFLKSDSAYKAQDLEKLYAEDNAALSSIVKEHNLLTLSDSKLKVSASYDAATMINPYPHLEVPTYLGNFEKRPEFVIPMNALDNPIFDDFSDLASALILTAHEARPGHDTQFETMMRNHLPLIRTHFAFTSAIVEGWAVYAVDIVYPYIPLEAQFAATRIRLLRIARQFLEPMLLLGKITKKEITDVLSNQLGFSIHFSNLEYKRYAFNNPGQSPAYYYGYKQIIKIKKLFRQKVGTHFSEKCFNDNILRLGLMPYDILRQRMLNSSCKL